MRWTWSGRTVAGPRPCALRRSGQPGRLIRPCVLARAAGGPAIPEPCDALARQIGEAADRVTNAQVAAVRAELGSDQAAFEIVMAASIGAGLARWDTAIHAIEEAGDAPT